MIMEQRRNSTAVSDKHSKCYRESFWKRKKGERFIMQKNIPGKKDGGGTCVAATNRGLHSAPSCTHAAHHQVGFLSFYSKCRRTPKGRF